METISTQTTVESKLGKFVGIASMPTTGQKLSPTKLRYNRQNLATKLLPGERIEDCGRKPAPYTKGKGIQIKKRGGTAYFSGLCVCGSVWGCAVCAARISEERRREMLQAINSKKYVRLMITYTLRHNLGDRLNGLLKALKDSYRFLKAGGEWQELKDAYSWVGSISSGEITYGDNNGWHPHIHELVLLDREKLGAETVEEIEGEIRALGEWVKSRWMRSVAKFGRDASWEHGVDVRVGDENVAEYVEKWGREPANVGWTLDRELTKSAQKQANQDGKTPLQLLDAFGEGDLKAGQLFREYYYSVKGGHQLQWSKGLRTILGLTETAPTDEEIAEQEPEGEILTDLAWEQFKVLLHAPVYADNGQRMADSTGKPLFQDLRADALEVISSSSVEYFWQWAYSKGVPQVVHVDLREDIPAKPVAPVALFGADYERKYAAYQKDLADWTGRYGKV